MVVVVAVVVVVVIVMVVVVGCMQFLKMSDRREADSRYVAQ